MTKAAEHLADLGLTAILFSIVGKAVSKVALEQNVVHEIINDVIIIKDAKALLVLHVRNELLNELTPSMIIERTVAFDYIDDIMQDAVNNTVAFPLLKSVYTDEDEEVFATMKKEEGIID